MQTITHTHDPLPPLADDDDLFAHIRPAPRSTDRRITCRSCGLFVAVPVDHPALLCPPCLSDVPGTRQRLIARAKAVCAAWDAAWDTWRDAEAALAPEQVQRWTGLKTALDRGVTPTEEQRIRAIAADATDPLSRLLRLAETSKANQYSVELNAIKAALVECEVAL